MSVLSLVLSQTGRLHARARLQAGPEIVGCVNRSSMSPPSELQAFPQFRCRTDTLHPKPDLVINAIYGDCLAFRAGRVMQVGGHVLVDKLLASTVAAAEKLADIARGTNRSAATPAGSAGLPWSVPSADPMFPYDPGQASNRVNGRSTWPSCAPPRLWSIPACMSSMGCLRSPTAPPPARAIVEAVDVTRHNRVAVQALRLCRAKDESAGQARSSGSRPCTLTPAGG